MIKEVENYLVILSELHAQVIKIMEGLPREALDFKPLLGDGEHATNSMGALAVHLAGSEAYWAKEVIGGRPIIRDREAEFKAAGSGFADLKAALEAAAKETEAIFSSLAPMQLEEMRKSRDRSVSVRWAILHLIEHYALHLGHMQLTRQLWMFQSTR
jgi:uncharacterized damage-inducible protein DinB